MKSLRKIKSYLNKSIYSAYFFLSIKMVKKVRNSLKILKKGGFCNMISTVKRKIAIEKELLSKIEWACLKIIIYFANIHKCLLIHLLVKNNHYVSHYYLILLFYLHH